MQASTQPQLLESARHLNWLPDETVYSLASRHHRLSGNVRPEQTARQLFGHARGGYPHDLPAGLAYFAQILGMRLGSATQIAVGHSILPILLAFRGTEDRADALAAMSSARLGSLKSRLGLPASGFGAMSLLKACPSCITSDIAMHGTGYWHVEHQLPGAWLCSKHEEFLHFSCSKRAGQQRFDWLLPGAAELRPIPAAEANHRAEGPEALRHLAKIVVKASAMLRSVGVPRPAYDRAIWSGLIDRGYALRPGRLRGEAISRDFERYVRPIATFPDWTGSLPTAQIAYSQIHAAIQHPNRGHALRTMLLVAFLFEDWDAFIEACTVEKIPDQEAFFAPPEQAADRTRSKFLDLIRDKGHSISGAAKSVGVSVATGQGWAAAVGVEPPRRASKIRDATSQCVVAALTSGLGIPTVASRFDVSEVSVRRLLRTRVGLRELWEQAKREKSREKYRSLWRAALDFESAIGPGAARALEPKAYAWLYRNDLEWLLEFNGKASLPRTGNHARVDWDRRDIALSESCSRAALQLLDASERRRVSLIDVLKLVPEVRTKICHLDRLPLTSRVLRSIIKARI